MNTNFFGKFAIVIFTEINIDCTALLGHKVSIMDVILPSNKVSIMDVILTSNKVSIMGIIWCGQGGGTYAPAVFQEQVQDIPFAPPAFVLFNAVTRPIFVF